MPITLITGPANAGKARAVLDAVARHVAHGEQPLLVLPTGADADRYRRELAQAGPVAGVSVGVFAGLLERVARCAAVQEPELGRQPLSEGAREQMLCTLAAGMQGSTVAARRLVRALVGAIAELQAADVRPAQLRASLHVQAIESEPRALLLTQLHERYREILTRAHVLDAELRARRALDVLRARPALWRTGARPSPVLLYGFDDLTSLEMDTVETLGIAVDAPVTVALAYEPGRVAFAGRAWAFQELAPRAAEHVRLPPRSDYYAPGSRAALHHIERRLFEATQADVQHLVPQSTQRASAAGEQLSLIEACDSPVSPNSGERPVASADGVQLLRGSSPQTEVALIAAQAHALMQDGFCASEIAIVHRSPASVAELLAQALDAEGVPHQIMGARKLVDTALGGALRGLLACGCEGLDGVPPAGLQHLLCWLRAPGLLERSELADRLEAQARGAGVRDAAPARLIWEQQHWRLDAIERVRDAARQGVGALIDCAHRELMRLFSAPRAGVAAVLDPSHEEAALSMQAALKTIAELEELERIEPELVGGAAGVLDAFAAAQLPRTHASSAPAVALLHPLALRARRVRALFACGLQEGVFPAAVGSHPLFTEEMRARIATICGPRLGRRQDVLAAERYLLYATVSRPQERLYLSWHQSGQDGTGGAPSLFLDDVCDLFGEDLRRDRVEDSPAQPASAVSVKEVTPSRGIVAEGIDRDLLLEMGGRELWSASSLERWAACPVSWFIERLLRVQDLEPEPEPRARGSLAHAVLGDVLEGLRLAFGSARISPASLPAAKQLLEQALERREQELPLTVAQERVPTARRRLQADLERYLQHAGEQDSPLEPTHLELSFGFPETPESLPALKLADGVLLRGRIDRIDVGPGGQAIVYDYKSGRTGSGHSGARWVSEGRFQMALYMRAAGELLGLDVVGGLYQPLAGGDLRARGLLAGDCGIELSCVRTDSVDREQMDELVRSACESAVQAALQAKSAQIQARPASCAYGGGCAYPTICRCRC
jgi:RecB family exonuclease